MLRKIIFPQEDQYLIKIPPKYINKELEILIFPRDIEYEAGSEETDEFDLSEITSDEDMRLFWASFGSWQDDRTAEEIIEDIYTSRSSTEREVHL
jgi:hypothetical protein